MNTTRGRSSNEALKIAAAEPASLCRQLEHPTEVPPSLIRMRNSRAYCDVCSPHNTRGRDRGICEYWSRTASSKLPFFPPESNRVDAPKLYRLCRWIWGGVRHSFMYFKSPAPGGFPRRITYASRWKYFPTP